MSITHSIIRGSTPDPTRRPIPPPSDAAVVAPSVLDGAIAICDKGRSNENRPAPAEPPRPFWPHPCPRQRAEAGSPWGWYSRCGEKCNAQGASSQCNRAPPLCENSRPFRRTEVVSARCIRRPQQPRTPLSTHRCRNAPASACSGVGSTAQARRSPSPAPPASISGLILALVDDVQTAASLRAELKFFLAGSERPMLEFPGLGDPALRRLLAAAGAGVRAAADPAPPVRP